MNVSATIRADKLEIGRRYLVQVHGQTARVMTLREKPDVSISKMGDQDMFVFGYGTTKNPREMVFQAHQNKGPKFLHTLVESKRGEGLAKARVTFLPVPKREAPAPVAAEAPKSGRGRPRKIAA